MKVEVTRTERGWAGHFICADDCLFRRNTLLEYGETKIVVSTVGLMIDHFKNKDKNGKMKFSQIGCGRNFETMAFHAQRVDDRYWDADVSKQVNFDSEWMIAEEDADDRANDMHEKVVDEIIEGLKSGNEYKAEKESSR